MVSHAVGLATRLVAGHLDELVRHLVKSLLELFETSKTGHDPVTTHEAVEGRASRNRTLETLDTSIPREKRAGCFVIPAIRSPRVAQSEVVERLALEQETNVPKRVAHAGKRETTSRAKGSS